MPDQIDAGSLRLERWRLTHADDALSAIVASRPELARWLAWAVDEPSRQELVDRIAREIARFETGNGFEYFVLDGDELVGAVGCGIEDDGVVSIGYWVRTDRTGRGVASVAVGALAKVLGATFGGDRLQIECDRDNDASAAVAARLGFTVVGERTFTPVTSGHSGVELLWRLSAPDP